MGSITPPTIDSSVLAALREGSLEALEECYRVFGARVYRICRSMLQQKSDAEDATQDVFLKLFERASQFQGRSKFFSWLQRIAINHCLQRIEKEGLRRAALIDERLADQGPTPLEAIETLEGEARVEALLSRLPANHRAVLLLREVEGFSYAEIADALEIPEGTVMSRLARARENLALLLIDPDEECKSRYAQ